LGGSLKITRVAQIFGPQKSYVLSMKVMGWATFWAIFSQTHLVTLALTDTFGWLPNPVVTPCGEILTLSIGKLFGLS
jgi:hypothetical protein